jgi:hypothetical protein
VTIATGTRALAQGAHRVVRYSDTATCEIVTNAQVGEHPVWLRTIRPDRSRQTRALEHQRMPGGGRTARNNAGRQIG